MQPLPPVTAIQPLQQPSCYSKQAAAACCCLFVVGLALNNNSALRLFKQRPADFKCAVRYTIPVTDIRFHVDPFVSTRYIYGTEIKPGKHSDTRRKPLPLVSGHGRYTTVTPERTLTNGRYISATVIQGGPPGTAGSEEAN
jgi:hypothetical protein